MPLKLYYDQHDGVERAILHDGVAVLHCFFNALQNPTRCGEISMAKLERILPHNKGAFCILNDGTKGFLDDAPDGLRSGHDLRVQIKTDEREGKAVNVSAQ
jgi:hypothetical protein